MSVVLETKGLTKRYGSLKAIDNLSLTINKGEVFGILGPNGSGKTTTLGIVLDVLNASDGSFSWFGETQGVNVRKRIGAILEHPIFYPDLSGRKNLEIAAQIKEVSINTIDPILERIGLKDRGDSKFKQYSLGMKQRLALGSALLAEPEVLVLDEPTNGLDPQGIGQMRELILSIAKEGKTIIIASHLLDEVQKMCSHYAILKKGTLLQTGEVAGLLQSKNKFTLKSSHEQFQEVLKSHPLFENSHSKSGAYLVGFKGEVEGSELNAFFAKQFIYLSHIQEHESSLEEEFINLINKN